MQVRQFMLLSPVAPGLEHAVKLGYRRIIVFPYFLFTGILVERIYSITDQIAAANPQINFVKAGYLSAHELVVDTFVDRLNGIATGNLIGDVIRRRSRQE